MRSNRYQKYNESASGWARRQRYRASPKGKAQRRADSARRRARLLGADVGDATTEFVVELLNRETCEYCHRSIPFEFRQIEHMQPLALGGLHCVANLCMACSKCNHKKGSRTRQAFLDWLATEEGYKWKIGLKSQH